MLTSLSLWSVGFTACVDANGCCFDLVSLDEVAVVEPGGQPGAGCSWESFPESPPGYVPEAFTCLPLSPRCHSGMVAYSQLPDGRFGLGERTRREFSGCVGRFLDDSTALHGVSTGWLLEPLVAVRKPERSRLSGDGPRPPSWTRFHPQWATSQRRWFRCGAAG